MFLSIFHFSLQSSHALEIPNTNENDSSETIEVEVSNINEGSSESVEAESTDIGTDIYEVDSFSTNNILEDNIDKTIDFEADNEITIKSSNSSHSISTQRNTINNQVIELRNKLSLLGFQSSDKPEDSYGESTKKAVTDFQTYYNLSKSDEVNSVLDQLNAILNSSLKQGANNSDVILLKDNLVKLGFGNFVGNQYYGPSTEATVRDFQSFYGLKRNGIADSRTLAKINQLLSEPMKLGDHRKDAIMLKQNLAKLGFVVSNNPTPDYGPQTERTVKAFQEYYGLNQVNGMADQSTLNKIDELLSSPLQIGREHDATIKLKSNLSQLGFGNFAGNRSYGPATEASVKELQSYYGLVVNGIADEPTLSLIESELGSPFRKGQVHDDVIQLKKDLTRLGFGNFSYNGTYWTSTETAVRDFQSFYGLKRNGIADSRTLAKINQLLNEPMKLGDHRKDAITLKQNLAKLGFVVSSNPTPDYGPKTASTVMDFQRYYGITKTGMADQATIDKIEELLSTSLQLGTQAEEVIQLKKDLVKLGFGSFNYDRSFGPLTETTVKEFQSFYGLKANGIADSRTLEKINQLINTPMKIGDYRKDAITLKQNLAILGFGVSNNYTPDYDQQTSNRVKEFQEYYKVSTGATGEADLATIEKLETLISTQLQFGGNDPQVVKLKKDLVKLGFGNFAFNQYYGATTEAIVRSFQAYYGLVVNGIADERTLEEINNILNSPLREGQSHDDTVQLKQDLVRLGFGSFEYNRDYGPKTARIVGEFQEYYGLRVNYIADQPTLNKIQEILNSHLREGQANNDVIQLKSDLSSLGFGEFSPNNTNYGPLTAKAVGEFQQYYGLRVNQIADQPTLHKIQEILNSPLRIGQSHDDVIQLKKDLVKIGYGNFAFTRDFGPTTEKVVKEFQKAHNLPVSGIVDEFTLALIKDLARSFKYTSFNITLDQALDFQMKASPQTDSNYAYVSATYIKNNEVIADSLNVRAGPSINRTIVGSLSRGAKVKVLSKVDGWYQIEYSRSVWVDPVRSDVEYYLNPDNFRHNERQLFQFLDLSRPSGANETILNNFLKGKGILEGMGQAFIDAGRIHGVNDIYLLSHALLETGHGKSPLSTGVRVGKNSSGNLVLVTQSNENTLTDIKITYNMFGIGAVDHNAHQGGAFRAYQEGWFTPKDAIIGGAV